MIFCAVMWNATEIEQEIQAEVIDAFVAFKADHEKSYDTEEEEQYRSFSSLM